MATTTTRTMSVSDFVVVSLRQVHMHYCYGDPYYNHRELDPVRAVSYGEIMAMRPGQTMILSKNGCRLGIVVGGLPSERTTKKRLKQALWREREEGYSFWEEDVLIRTKKGVKIILYHYDLIKDELSTKEVINVILD